MAPKQQQKQGSSSQARPPPSSSQATTLHVVALASHLHSLYTLFNLPLLFEVTLRWYYQFLTTITLSVSTLCFFLACSADLRRTLKSPDDALVQLIFSVKQAVSCVAAPGEVLVTVLYAGLRLISRDLVLPDWAQLPLVLDLSLHLLPAVFQVMDCLLLSPPLPITLPQSLCVDTVLAAGYWYWTEASRTVYGVYAYPIFDQVGLGGRLGLFAMSAVLITAFTLVLQTLHDKIHAPVNSRKKRQ